MSKKKRKDRREEVGRRVERGRESGERDCENGERERKGVGEREKRREEKGRGEGKGNREGKGREGKTGILMR